MRVLQSDPRGNRITNSDSTVTDYILDNHYSHIRLEAKRQALAGLVNRGLDPVTSQSTSQREKPAEAGSPNYSF